MDIRNEVLSRVYIALFALCGFALFIFARAVNISVVEGEKWRGLGDKLYLEYRPCLLYTSPSPRDRTRSRMPSSA